MTTIEHDLAVKIVGRLFAIGCGEQADGMALKTKNASGTECDHGGWCREAAIEQVKQVLEAELKLQPKEKESDK